MWFLLFTLVLANNHLERCKATINPSIRRCNDNHDCKCNVLAREGGKCLRSAPAGSLVDLIRSVDGGACMRTHFMDLSVLDNLAELDTNDLTVSISEFENRTDATSPQAQTKGHEEDVRDEQLASKYASMAHGGKSIIKSQERVDTSPHRGTLMVSRLATAVLKWTRAVWGEQLR